MAPLQGSKVVLSLLAAFVLASTGISTINQGSIVIDTPSQLAFNLPPTSSKRATSTYSGSGSRTWSSYHSIPNRDAWTTRGGMPTSPLPSPSTSPLRRHSRSSEYLLMSENGGGGGGAPWIARGLKRLMRGGRSGTSGTGGGGGSQLPSLSAVMEAVDAKGNANSPQASDKMAELLAAPLPMHPQVREGVLPNGLKYIILPNSSPPERFEAHLEVFAGSADELDKQQGMAHLVEHIAYMGSRKRERLFGTGSQTNAYTDFHHTVFYASCPVLTPPGWGMRTPMLGRALGALCDVFEAVCEESRLEKERSAVLSEMTMVNTIDYRMECQILSALHAENQLCRRFPIGKEELIRSWSTKDVLEFHRTHYRPDNAIVYCIGDLEVEDCEEQIRKTFGHLGGKPQDQEMLTLKAQSRHFPPVSHQWSGGHITPDNSLPVMEPFDQIPLGRPRVFGHDLLQAFSLHVFAKRPIEPMSSLGDFRRAIMKRIALAAMQIRLSVNSRTDPPFLSIEFNQLDSPREGCAVCYLDMTAEPSKWKDAVRLAVKEIRRLGMYGLTEGELQRFSSALLTDSRQLAAQGNRINNGDQLTFLMESVASGHTFMDTQQTYMATRLVMESLTLEEVNEVAAEVCEHVTLFGVPAAAQPSAMVACVPTKSAASANEGSDGGISVNISGLTEEDVLQAFNEGVCEEINESEDISVPESFFTPSELEDLNRELKPAWAPMADPKGAEREGQWLGVGDISQDQLSVTEETTGTKLRRLNNGIHVNMVQHTHESQRGQLRVLMPGGRQLEQVLGKGSVAIGARTMQEGGAFGDWMREQVELFCIDHLIMVTVDANDEYLQLDLAFPTTKLHSRGRNGMGGDGGDSSFGLGEDGHVKEGVKLGEEGVATDESLGLSGMEAAFQVLHKIMTGYVWEEDALKRAKQSFMQAHETAMKSLEGSSTEALMHRMSGGDDRFMSIPPQDVEAVDLESASKAIQSHMTTSNMEVILVGDFSMEEAERLSLQYMGTVPASERDPSLMPLVEDIPHSQDHDSPKHIDLHLPDSDDRAVGYVAGEVPNQWGMMRGGGSVLDITPAKDANSRARRSHKLFAPAAMALLKEVVNRRLFSVVREQKRLTYDANIHLTNFQRILGSWYLVTVTANPDKVDEALKACQDTLRSLIGPQPITADNLESAKRVLINRHDGDLRSNTYWCDLLSGIQLDCMPQKDMTCVRDYQAVVNSVTTHDLEQILKGVTVDPKKTYTCTGVSGKKPEPRTRK